MMYEFIPIFIVCEQVKKLNENTFVVPNLNLITIETGSKLAVPSSL